MELKPIDSKNAQDVLALRPAAGQQAFVAPNAESLQDVRCAAASGRIAEAFGLYDGETPVGFVLLAFGRTGDDEEPDWAGSSCCIWRLMIDKRYQKRGFGTEALRLVLAYLRSFPHGRLRRCWLSYEPENETAKRLYHRFGFRETGETVCSELVAAVEL